MYILVLVCVYIYIYLIQRSSRQDFFVSWSCVGNFKKQKIKIKRIYAYLNNYQGEKKSLLVLAFPVWIEVGNSQVTVRSP